jgi:hypothetical protein
MVKHKNKNTGLRTTHKIERFIAHVGLTAMSVAAVAGLVELHEARSPKTVAVMQPTYAISSDYRDAGQEPIRREKDEIRHMSVSYGTSMRSHATAGTV